MSTLVIAGCGYLGSALAAQGRERGLDVLCLVRSEESAAELRGLGYSVGLCDLSDADSVARAAAECADSAPLLAHCAASGRGGAADAYRAVYLNGMRHLLAAFPYSRRMFFTSSSSVYAQTNGSVITEASPAIPDRETGRILRETEDLTLATGRGIAGRLAGIYGPGRSVLLRQFLMGESRIDIRTEPPATPDGRWVNQIHRDDAAAAILHLLLDLPATDATGRVWNIADVTPLLQRPLYTELARRFGLPLPPEGAPDTGRKRGWTHKQVSSARLRSTGWQPRYPSWFHALDSDPQLVPSIRAQCAAGE